MALQVSRVPGVPLGLGRNNRSIKLFIMITEGCQKIVRDYKREECQKEVPRDLEKSIYFARLCIVPDGNEEC